MSFLLTNLKQQGLIEDLDFVVCTVGSRKISHSDDYRNQGWTVLAPNLTIYGFEADPIACEAANADFEALQADWNEFHLPLAIAKESGTSTLYVTKNPMCSSLYPPNETLLKRLFRLPAFVGLDYTTSVQTTTLDQFCNEQSIDTIDFLQMDIQGAELQALQGATSLLNRSVLAIQLEVEFSPLYSGQPLFADLDGYLRKQGFSLFDLELAREPRSLLCSQAKPGQVIWGEAIYLRDIIGDTTPSQFQTPDQILKLACIADLLEFTDYAFELLKYLTLHYGHQADYDFTEFLNACFSQYLSPEQLQQEMASLNQASQSHQNP